MIPTDDYIQRHLDRGPGSSANGIPVVLVDYLSWAIWREWAPPDNHFPAYEKENWVEFAIEWMRQHPDLVRD